jgi:hypothetical protein
MHVVVRYQTRPDRAEENQALIEKLFEDLQERQPRGFSYTAFRLEDGVSFIHVVTEHDEVADPDSLPDVTAFRAFTAGIADRCEVQPVAGGATVVGQYH